MPVTEAELNKLVAGTQLPLPHNPVTGEYEAVKTFKELRAHVQRQASLWRSGNVELLANAYDALNERLRLVEACRDLKSARDLFSTALNEMKSREREFAQLDVLGRVNMIRDRKSGSVPTRAPEAGDGRGHGSQLVLDAPEGTIAYYTDGLRQGERLKAELQCLADTHAQKLNSEFERLTVAQHDLSLRVGQQIRDLTDLRRLSIEELKIELEKAAADHRKGLEAELEQLAARHEEGLKAELNLVAASHKARLDAELESISSTHSEVKVSAQEWFRKLQETCESGTERLQAVEKAYGEKLFLEEPANYWKELETRHRIWAGIWCVLSLLGAAILARIVVNVLYRPPEMLQGQDMTLRGVRGILLVAVLISALGYWVHLFARLSLSGFHLARDCRERFQLTMVYLALIKKGALRDEDRPIILQSLFSRADTGLLKSDSTPTMPGIGGVIETLGKAKSS